MSETGRVINARPALCTTAVERVQTASYATMAAFILAALTFLLLKTAFVGSLSLVVISTGLLTGLAGIAAMSSFSVAVAFQPVKEPPDGHLG